MIRALKGVLEGGLIKWAGPKSQLISFHPPSAIVITQFSPVPSPLFGSFSEAQFVYSMDLLLET